jgi:hypothetical protein
MAPPLGPIGTARRLIRTIGRAAIAQSYEVGLMASVAATAPWHLAGGGFWPPVGALPAIDAHTAPTARPALLVHGFGGTSTRMTRATAANPGCAPEWRGDGGSGVLR